MADGRSEAQKYRLQSERGAFVPLQIYRGTNVSIMKSLKVAFSDPSAKLRDVSEVAFNALFLR